MQSDERAADAQQTSEEPIARLNYGAADERETSTTATRVVWGPKAIALGVLAVVVMVVALLLIIQGVYEVRPQ
jgi:hypothetical protein